MPWSKWLRNLICRRSNMKNCYSVVGWKSGSCLEYENFTLNEPLDKIISYALGYSAYSDVMEIFKIVDGIGDLVWSNDVNFSI